ncbi:MAG: SH3 domain-containing protein [Candidatus Coprovivens sp.]
MFFKNLLILFYVLMLIVGCCDKSTQNVEMSNEFDKSKFQVKVVIDNINIRKAPTLSSDLIGQVAKNDIYDVIDYIADDEYVWFHIRTNNNIDGYIGSEIENPYVEFLNVPDGLDFVAPSLKILNKEIKLKKREDLNLEKVLENIEYSDESPVTISYDIDYSNIVANNSYKLNIVATDISGNKNCSTIIVEFTDERQVSAGKWLAYEELESLRNKYKKICNEIGGKVVSSYSCEYSYGDKSFWQIFEYGLIVIGTNHNFEGFHGVWCQYDDVNKDPKSCFKATRDGQSYDSVDYLTIEDEINSYLSRAFNDINKYLDKGKESGYLITDLNW